MNSIRKLLSWITTIPFLIGFALVLLVFHVFQVISIRIGYHAHNRVISSMIWWLNNVLLLSGNYIKFTNHAGKLPTDRPMIVISNHQSMYDIPAIGWALKPYHPKFIAKKSLAKGLPSVSFNIRNGGSIAIDRKDQLAASKAIINLCKYLKKHNRAGVIFAEGRREKDGNVLPFKKLGLGVMLEKMPNAIVIPVVLENFWYLEQFKLFPVPLGYQYRCTVLSPLDREKFNNEAIIHEAERVIRVAMKQEKEVTS